MASLMLAGAKIGKMYGAKKVFRFSLWIYGAGTLIAAMFLPKGRLADRKNPPDAEK